MKTAPVAGLLAFLSACILSSPAALGAPINWVPADLAKQATSLLAATDLRDTAALAQALGAPITLRPYCGRIDCAGVAPIGMLHAFPDPPLRLSGPAQLSAQFYLPSRLDPPIGGTPRSGILAVLDLLLPPAAPCIARAGLNASLGPEGTTGATLGMGEPNDIAVTYVVRRDRGVRRSAEFVFAGPPSPTGCLAFISLREDTFDVPLAASEPRPPGSFENPFTDGDAPIDQTDLPDLFGASVARLPLGLSVAEVVRRFPACKPHDPAAAETLSPLTDARPDALPLLPVAAGRYLVTDHGIWDTVNHDTPSAPALDATLVSRLGLDCTLPNPMAKYAWRTLSFQHYALLILGDHIMGIGKRGGGNSTIPAQIATAELIAQSGGTGAHLAWSNVVTLLPLAPRVTVVGMSLPPSITPRVTVIGMAVLPSLIEIVEAFGPAQTSNTISPSIQQEFFLDRPLWSRYSEQVRHTLRNLAQGRAGTARAVRMGSAPPAAAPTPTRLASAIFLERVKALAEGGNLLDVEAFARAVGGRPVLLNLGSIARMVSDASTTPYTVGLMPGPTLLDGLSFSYTIVPSGVPDSLHRLPPFHRLLAQIDIANYAAQLYSRYCLSHQAVQDAFGANQMVGNERAFTYTRKSRSRLSPNDTVYLVANFDLPRYPPTGPDCATSITLSQYRAVRP